MSPSVRPSHKSDKEVSDELFLMTSERSDFSIRTYETSRGFGWKATCMDCGREWGDWALKVSEIGNGDAKKTISLLPLVAGQQIGKSEVIWKHGNCKRKK